MEKVTIEPLRIEESHQNADTIVQHKEPKVTFAAPTDTEMELNERQVAENCREMLLQEQEENDHLQELQISKLREHNTWSLNHLLRIEAEMLANLKAEEEVTVCVLQSHLQEAQENQKQLNEDVSRLQSMKEQMQDELNRQSIHRDQLNHQMRNTEKMLQMLEQSCEVLQVAGKEATSDVEHLEKEYSDQVKMYQQKKSQRMSALEVVTEEIKKLGCFQQEIFSRQDMENSNWAKEIQNLIEENQNISELIMEWKEKIDNVKYTLSVQEKEVLDIIAENSAVQDLTNGIDLQNLEKQKVESERNYEDIHRGLESNLIQLQENLSEAEHCEVKMNNTLEEVITSTRQLEAADAALEDELSVLLSRQEELKNAVNENEIEESSALGCITNDMQSITLMISKFNFDINEILKLKHEKLEKVKDLEQNEKNAAAELVYLKNYHEKLVDNINESKAKLERLHQDCGNLQKDFEMEKLQQFNKKKGGLKREQKYCEKVDGIVEKLQFVKGLVETTIQDRDQKIHKIEMEHDVLKNDSEKSFQQNEEAYEEKLKELNSQLESIQKELQKKKNDTEMIQLVINEKKVNRDKLLAQMGGVNREIPQNHKYKANNTQNSKISKSIKKRNTRKKVTWRSKNEASLSSSISDTESQPAPEKTANQMFADMLDGCPISTNDSEYDTYEKSS